MEIRLDSKWILGNIPPRARNVNKGSLGTVNILAGSSLYRGAASLAVSGALRAGAGMVRLASTEKVCAAVAAQHSCCLLRPISENASGGIEYSEENYNLFREKCTTTVLAGCGMCNTEETARWIETVLRTTSCPVVVDADGLNVIAGHMDYGNDHEIRSRCNEAMDEAKMPLVLTPHIGEMARLSGLTIREVEASQREVARDYAVAHNCVVVLKSHVTVVAAPDNTLYINYELGNPGMAKGGSGDVLSGIIASLMAQGIRPQIAAAAGVWLHASAGDLIAQQNGMAGMSPEEIPLALCNVWAELGR